MVMGRITVWVGSKIYEELKKQKINVSREVRLFLKKMLEERGVKIDEPEVVIRVRCVFCENEFETSSITQAKCPKCGKTFRIYTKKYGSRIREIAKGSREELFKLYYRKRKEDAQNIC